MVRTSASAGCKAGYKNKLPQKFRATRRSNSQWYGVTWQDTLGPFVRGKIRRVLHKTRPK